jgi:hypothetical protein
MQVTVCSRKDQFVKAKGREMALAAEKHSVNVRSLAFKLAELKNITRNTTYHDEIEYLYVYKYIV